MVHNDPKVSQPSHRPSYERNSMEHDGTDSQIGPSQNPLQRSTAPPSGLWH